jgi:hypothetical protein
VRDIWNDLDEATARQGKMAQNEAFALGELERKALEATLPDRLQPIASSSVAVTGATVDVSVAKSEVNEAYAGGGSFNGLDGALGSRAHPFISRRADGDRAIEEQLQRVVAPSGATPDEIQILPTFKGSSFFTKPGMFDARYSFSHGQRAPQAYASWADEHGQVSVNYLGGFVNERDPREGDTRHARWFRGSQSSTDEQNTGDTHEWCPVDLKAESQDPSERHTLEPHALPPPNEPDPCLSTAFSARSCIWPSLYDVNAALIAVPGDVFAQPKLMTVATKDLAAQKDPWNLFLRFRFSRSGGGEQVDFRQKHAVGNAGAPEFQSLSAGMAYYHRPGHWKEHPNFFNPYWRASLVRATIDDAQWRGHMSSTLAGSHNATLNALWAAGYRGIP